LAKEHVHEILEARKGMKKADGKEYLLETAMRTTWINMKSRQRSLNEKKS